MTTVPPERPPEGEPGLPDLSSVVFVVPDDISELDDDVAAFRHAARQVRRRARLRQVGAALGWHPTGPSAASITGMVVLVALVVGSAVGLLPGRTRPPRPLAAALAAPTAAPGVPGALLPDITISVAGGTFSVRELRPAVLVLLPLGCDCAAAVHAVVGSAQTSGLRVYLVAAGAPGSLAADQAERLAAGRLAGGTHAVVVYDTGLLDTTYRPAHAVGPIAVFVRPDGIVAGRALALTGDSHIESRLDELLPAPAAPS